MPEEAFIELPGHRLRYRIDADAAPPAAAWLVFCNSLGTDLTMWDTQVADLARHFRVLRYDSRGHGASTAPAPPYSIADLSADTLALMDRLDIERAHFCGLSIGGLIGQWLGVHAGHRLDRIVLCATAAKIGTADTWQARIAAVRESGLAPLGAATLGRWFTPTFEAEHPDAVADILERFLQVDPAAYNGCCEALAGADLREEIAAITNPVLAISGHDDPVCSPPDLQFIADRVQRGRHISLPGRHIVNLESARAFNAALLDVLTA